MSRPKQVWSLESHRQETERLLRHLRALRDFYGRWPSEAVINRHGPPSHMKFVRWFGGMRKAQELAGVR